MLRASVFGIVNSGFIPSRVQPMALKLPFTALLYLTLSMKRTMWRTSQKVCLLLRWEKHLAEFFHLRVVDRWPTTGKRARYSDSVAFL